MHKTILVLSILVSLVQISFAQDTESDFQEVNERKDFSLAISPYAWLAGNATDVGGFGLGNSSKFAWDFAYANTFKVSNLILVTAGYRSFRYKRIDGTGEDELKTKVHAYGPFIGVSFVL